jgi:hypothetical protein
LLFANHKTQNLPALPSYYAVQTARDFRKSNRVAPYAAFNLALYRRRDPLSIFEKEVRRKESLRNTVVAFTDDAGRNTSDFCNMTSYTQAPTVLMRLNTENKVGNCIRDATCTWKCHVYIDSAAGISKMTYSKFK